MHDYRKSEVSELKQKVALQADPNIFQQTVYNKYFVPTDMSVGMSLTDFRRVSNLCQ